MRREQEVQSLQHKLTVSDEQLEKTEAKLSSLKAEADSGAAGLSNAESLQRKVALLEEELDQSERNLKETMEKYVFPFRNFLFLYRRFGHYRSRRSLVLSHDYRTAPLTRRLLHLGFVKLTLRRNTLNARFNVLSLSGTSGRRNAR